jgi:TetR/AcrR family transcriptional regulator, regulator of autoinduction and epiphytic fitness
VQTVYAAFGSKRQLLSALVDVTIAGDDEPVALPDREFVAAIRAAPTARAKLACYARHLAGVQARQADVVLALSGAATADPDAAEIWRKNLDDRRRGMLGFAADLAATGEIRPGLDQDHVADVLWLAMDVRNYDWLVRQRRWSPEQYQRWYADTVAGALLGDPSPPGDDAAQAGPAQLTLGGEVAGKQRRAEVVAGPAQDGMGVVGAPLGVVVFDQQSGCLYPVVVPLSGAQPASPREGGIGRRDGALLILGYFGGEPCQVDGQQLVELATRLAWQPGRGNPWRRQRAGGGRGRGDDVARGGRGDDRLVPESGRQAGHEGAGEVFLAQQRGGHDPAVMIADLRGISAEEQRSDNRPSPGHGHVDGQVMALESPRPSIVAGAAEDGDVVSIAAPPELPALVKVEDLLQRHDRDGLRERGPRQRGRQELVRRLPPGDRKPGQGDAVPFAGKV